MSIDANESARQAGEPTVLSKIFSAVTGNVVNSTIDQIRSRMGGRERGIREYAAATAPKQMKGRLLVGGISALVVGAVMVFVFKAALWLSILLALLTFMAIPAVFKV